ncbi:MAG: prolipoprotein diacylglyceryl transferase [Planctomycetota bacterium]
MHPILFKLPLVDWPVRLFGLFVLDAFFLATLWAQWQMVRLKDPAIRDDAALTKRFRMALLGTVISRVVFMALPIPWVAILGGILVTDFALYFFARAALNRASDEAAKKEAEFLFNLTFWLLLIGFFGARLFWIFTTSDGRETFPRAPLEALFAIWDGGIVYYGGLLCSAAFGVWYLWLKSRNILAIGDILTAGVALTIYMGRWACFSAGCDYGEPTDLPWGVVFPSSEGTLVPPQYLDKVAIHPTQLYLSLNGLVIFGILAFVLARKRFDGQVTYLFLMLYPIGRSFVERFRGDEGRGLYEIFEGFSLSSSQIISVPVFVVALLLYIRAAAKARKRRKAEAAVAAEGAEG